MADFLSAADELARDKRRLTKVVAGWWGAFVLPLLAYRWTDPAPFVSATSKTADLVVAPVLARELRTADDVASVYGNFHRACQAILLVVAVLAALLGTLGVVLPSLKVGLVGAEFLLALGALFLWSRGQIATNHQRWSETRRYAERLRVMKVTQPLGFDIRDDGLERPRSWSEWRARAVLRIVGPPTGALRRVDLVSRASAACDDPHGIIAGQVDYHRRNHARMYKAHDNTHSVEAAAFLFLLGSLAFFSVAATLASSSPVGRWFVIVVAGLILFLARRQLWRKDVLAFAVLGPVLLLGLILIGKAQGVGLAYAFSPIAVGAAIKDSYGKILVVFSAVIPLLAAAIIALEAKVGFLENARRSQQLLDAFADLHRRMEEQLGRPKRDEASAATATAFSPIPQAQTGPEASPAPTPNPAMLTAILREAGVLHLADADSWRDGATRRQIVKL